MTAEERARLIGVFEQFVRYGIPITQKDQNSVLSDLKRLDALEKALEWGLGSGDELTRRKCREALGDA